MRRSRTELLLLLPALLAACTLFPGRPWGEVEASLAVGFDPPATRLTGEGRLKTARDYEIALDRLALQVDALELEVAELDEGDGPVTFDPAQPPEGYSLCHGGHCHAADGRLVEYEVVERELGGGGGGFALTLPVAAGGLLDVTGADDEAVPLSPCPEGCLLERGELVSVGVWLSRLEVSGRVYDRRQGDAARLPEEGLPFALDLALSTKVQASVSHPLDGSEPPALLLDARLLAPPSLFDDVDFAAPSDDDADAVADRLQEDGELELAISRQAGLPTAQEGETR